MSLAHSIPDAAPQPFQAVRSSGETILRVTGASRAFAYRKAALLRSARTFNAVDGVSLELRKGETLAVVGESGCGKSTLGRLVSGLMRPSAGGVHFQDLDFSALSQAQWRDSRRKVQIIFQDAAGSLDPRLPVEDQVREPLDLHGLGTPAERRAKAQAMLEAVKLGRHLWKAVASELSGGQQQRVVIARAIILEPDLLVCDEPVSALDVSIQAQIIKILAEMQQRLRLTQLFISHDLAVVRQIADRIAVMYLGQIVECGPAEDVFNTPRHPYTKALLAAVPVPDPAVRGRRQLLAGDPPSPHTPPAGCRFHTRCPVARPICSQTPPAARTFGAHAVNCHFAEDAA